MWIVTTPIAWFCDWCVWLRMVSVVALFKSDTLLIKQISTDITEEQRQQLTCMIKEY